MHPFGIFLVLILIWTFIRTKHIDRIFIKLLTITICIEAFISVGYFLKLGSLEITYSEFLLVILGIISIFLIIIKPINKKLLTLGFCLIFVIIISNSLLLLNPVKQQIITYGMSWRDVGVYPSFNLQTIMMSFRIVLFVLVAMAAISTLKNNIEYLRTRFIKFGTFILMVIAFEFILKNIFHSNIFSSFINFLFGTGDFTVDVLLERGNTFSLQGLTREPNQLSTSLFYFGLIVLFSKDKIKHFNLIFIVTIVEMLASRSLGGILLSLCLLAVYFIKQNKMFLAVFTVILATPFVAFTNYFTYYLNRILNSLSFLTNTQLVNFNMSEQTRIYSIIENFNLALDSPFFGIGVGTSYAFGFLPSLLSNIGLLGFSFWLLFIFSGIANQRINFKNVLMFTLLILAWIPTGGLNTMYSMSLLLLMIILRSDSLRKTNLVRQERNIV